LLPLPEFANPPLTETAISVSFPESAALTNAQFGRFWQSVEDEFPKATELPPVGRHVELFESDPPDRLRQLAGRPYAPLGHRLRLDGESGSRLLQVQNDRFIYNWIQNDAASSYPRFGELRRRFQTWMDCFFQFAEDIPSERPVPFQWEITYVNHVPQGELWATPADWPSVFPGLMSSGMSLPGAEREWNPHQWTFRFREPDLRLYVESGTIRETREPSRELLRLQLTARGPCSDPASLRAGLDAGHRAIVLTFAEACSPRASEIWQKQSGASS